MKKIIEKYRDGFGRVLNVEKMAQELFDAGFAAGVASIKPNGNPVYQRAYPYRDGHWIDVSEAEYEELPHDPKHRRIVYAAQSSVESNEEPAE